MHLKDLDETDIELSPDMRVSLDIRLKDDSDADKNVITLHSIVEELLDDDYILIHMPIHQGYYYPLPHDEPILMKFMVGSDVYALNVQFEERVGRDSFLFAKMLRLDEIVPHQQRDCYRLPCSMPIAIERMWRSEEMEDLESAAIDGRTINFSDGGMLFLTNGNIERGEKLTLAFDIGVAEIVEGTALRVERVEDDDSGFRVAVQFMLKDELQKQRFYKYIVDKQLEERRRRRFL